MVMTEIRTRMTTKTKKIVGKRQKTTISIMEMDIHQKQRIIKK
ncbi:MAG: hypothetical protein R2680_13625 [Nitrososphaeraceae archaeon]